MSFNNGQDQPEGHQAEWDSPVMQDVRRDRVEEAMLELANGKEESTIPNLRNDLEQYGGTNDVTLIKGNEKKGIIHIEKRHGRKVFPFVLEAMANGKIVRTSRKDKTVAIQKDGYEAILSLDEHGKKKTWLLTGYDLIGEGGKLTSDERGKFCTRHAPTHSGPTSSRPGMGAEAIFAERILKILGTGKGDSTVALDRNSVRSVDENGYLHVKSSHISKATVNPYYGKEIPGWREEGLEPDKIYYGFRAPEELKKSVPTWAGLPLHIEHHIDSAEDPQKMTRVGAVGNNPVWNGQSPRA